MAYDICVFALQRVKGSLASIAVVAVLLSPISAQAQQYQVYQWANFDDGKLPASAAPFGNATDENLSVVDFSAVTGLPPEFHDSTAAQETGKYGLKLISNPDPAMAATYQKGLAFGTILDRDKLGATGKALYQADFFMPTDRKDVPSLAVLAMEPPRGVQGKEGEKAGSLTETAPNAEKKNPLSFYRFGLTVGKFLYFSCIRPTQTTATVFLQDSTLFKRMPCPGWHRFALVFDGPKTIRCFVDGQETSFSPFEDDTLRKLQVGIMLADNKRKYDSYVDNLSIQMSTEDAPIPQSPYAYLWKGTSSAGESGKARVPPKGSSTQGAGIWQADASSGWKKAQEVKKPFFLYFDAPGSPNSEKLGGIMDSDPKAKEFLAKHICARLDVNQLQGGTVAANYQIFKVPTVLIFSSDGKSVSRATFSRDDTWDAFIGKLSSN